MDEIKILCSYTKLVPMEELVKLRNPRNTNDHPPEQIDELVEQFKFQGIRHPIIISNRSNRFAAGDGRFQAAEKLGMVQFPTDWQDFDSEEQEFAFGVADNEIQKWSTINLKLVHAELPTLQPFEIDRLAIKDFKFEPDPGSGSGSGSGNPKLADRFLIPPFSVFNAREGWWQDRKRQWIALGIKSELGRGDTTPPGGGAEPLARFRAGDKSTWNTKKKLGAIAPNQNAILKRTGKYA